MAIPLAVLSAGNGLAIANVKILFGVTNEENPGNARR